jgi:antitoxin VapB
MCKDGDRLIIEPAPPASLLALLATLSPIDDEIDLSADPPPEPVEL